MKHHPSCPMSRGGKKCIGCGGTGPNLPNPLPDKKDDKKVTPRTTKKRGS